MNPDIMRKKELLDSLRLIITDQLGVSSEQVVPEARLVEDLRADSLDKVEMVLAVEGEFEIQLEDHRLEKVHTVGDALDLLGEVLNVEGVAVSDKTPETPETSEADGAPAVDKTPETSGLWGMFPVPWEVDWFPSAVGSRCQAVIYAADSTRVAETKGEHAKELAELIVNSVNTRGRPRKDEAPMMGDDRGGEEVKA